MATNISTIRINASVQTVWHTLTSPERVKQWQFGSDLLTTWEEGSRITFRTGWEGKVYEQWGTVLQVQPGRMVKYSLFAPRPGVEDKPENYFTMTYLLTPQDHHHTQLEIIQEDNRPGAVQEKPQGGENPVLQSLKQLAEKQ